MARVKTASSAQVQLRQLYRSSAQAKPGVICSRMMPIAVKVNNDGNIQFGGKNTAIRTGTAMKKRPNSKRNRM